MDFGHDDVRIITEEDRLSSLPDDLIHQILSFIDIKFAVQTSSLSKRWKLVWTSMPSIKISSRHFPTLPKFSKFVTHVLSHRNNQVELSSVSLHFTGEVSQVFVRRIVNYALSHNVQQIEVYCSPRKHKQFHLPLFSSQSLDRLSLGTYPNAPCIIPTTPWDLPRLTTLHLSQITLDEDYTNKHLDLFSKCVNLKNLTLHRLTVLGLEVFNICNPRLSTLMIRHVYPKFFNVVTPQLQNLTILNCSAKYWISAPGLSSLSYTHGPLQLTTDGFHSLDTVNLCLDVSSPYEEKDSRKIVGLLQVFHSAKFLTLNSEIIEAEVKYRNNVTEVKDRWDDYQSSLSSYPDLLSQEPSPFSNLKYVKIYQKELVKRKPNKVTMPSQVRNYFLDNSPNAIMDVPEELLKKSRKELLEARAEKKVKIESLMAELQLLLEHGKARSQSEEAWGERIKEVLENQREPIQQMTAPAESCEAKMLMQLKRQLAQIKSYSAKLGLQHEQDKAERIAMCSKMSDIKALLATLPKRLKLRAELEAQFVQLQENTVSFMENRMDCGAIQLKYIKRHMEELDAASKHLQQLFASSRRQSAIQATGHNI